MPESVATRSRFGRDLFRMLEFDESPFSISEALELLRTIACCAGVWLLWLDRTCAAKGTNAVNMEPHNISICYLLDRSLDAVAHLARHAPEYAFVSVVVMSSAVMVHTQNERRLTARE